jgi:3-isopropylmalate/(R)-2-methylmalate dehydratase small subunit
VTLDRANVDTDQIIPARYLKRIERTGYGEFLMEDIAQKDGRPDPDFVLNRPETQGATILVARQNFGCGSSREHAVWAIAQRGFRAVVAPRFADIFRSNALKNGLVPVIVPREAHAALVAAPGAEVTIDLETRTITLPGGGAASFPIDGFARYCLMNGIDELGYLLSQEEAIARFERARL